MKMNLANRIAHFCHKNDFLGWPKLARLPRTPEFFGLKVPELEDLGIPETENDHIVSCIS
jgi:hypothetical protein